jgi:Outer membrane protein beta-barrel domain
MKKCFAVLVVILVCAFVAAAQSTPKMEAFLGYDYVRFSASTNIPEFSANGGGGQFAYNFSKALSAVADVGAVHNGNISGAQIDNTVFNFLFGPRLSLGYSRIRPYFNVLFGGAYLAASTQVDAIAVATPHGILGGQPIIPGQPVTLRLGTSQTAFAMVAGGGLDIKISKHASFRPIGLDYYMTRFQNLRTQGDNNQNNLRYTAGINFTFGAQ